MRHSAIGGRIQYAEPSSPVQSQHFVCGSCERKQRCVQDFILPVCCVRLSGAFDAEALLFLVVHKAEESILEIIVR
jgi:hypothetical protein